MNRSIYVGVIFVAVDEGGTNVDYVLVEFLGEGNTGIVFRVAPRARPTEMDRVMKLYKPQPCFELGVLHYSLRIAEELYPDHPLLMPADERLSRLVKEMQQRIESPGVVFQVRPFVDLMYGTIEGLIDRFLPSYVEGSLPPDFLHVEPGFLPALDEGLALHVEGLLEQDAIVEAAQGFASHCVEAIREHAALRPVPTLSGNRPYKLLGMHLTDFISWDELLDILAHPDFAPPVQPDELELIATAASMMYHRALTLRDRKDQDYEQVVRTVLALARLAEEAAARLFADATEALRANALNWEARTLLLLGDTQGARERFERVVDVARSHDSQAERHDALLGLAGLDPNSPHVNDWVSEIQTIRQRLGIR